MFFMKLVQTAPQGVTVFSHYAPELLWNRQHSTERVYIPCSLFSLVKPSKAKLKEITEWLLETFVGSINRVGK